VLLLFFFGTETSSITLNFTLLILLKHLVVLGEHGLWYMVVGAWWQLTMMMQPTL
jgi:hypothetical protein